MLVSVVRTTQSHVLSGYPEQAGVALRGTYSTVTSSKMLARFEGEREEKGKEKKRGESSSLKPLSAAERQAACN